MGNRRRVYVFDAAENEPENTRFAVVHTSLKEAKKHLWRDSDVRDCCGNDYRNFKVRWLRHIDASGLEIGDDLISAKGVELGVYDWVDAECPICQKMGILRKSYDDDQVRCGECEELFEEEAFAGREVEKNDAKNPKN